MTKEKFLLLLGTICLVVVVVFGIKNMFEITATKSEETIAAYRAWCEEHDGFFFRNGFGYSCKTARQSNI